MKNKEELETQCKKFLENNNLKMQVVPIFKDYADYSLNGISGYQVYLVPKDSDYLGKEELKENGILIYNY